MRYIVKRVISALITIWFIMTLTFVLMMNIPGDPFTEDKAMNPEIKALIYKRYGLDQPPLVQYFNYLKNYIKGDFGVSYKRIGVTTDEIIMSGLPYSLKVGGAAALFIIVGGVLMGVSAALRQNRFTDRFVMVLSTLGATVPSFVFASLFLYIFSKKLGWVPAFGVGTWKHYIGPVLCVSMFNLSFLSRLSRTTVLDVMNQDYIRTARAKGLPESVVIGKHVMRNAIIPVVTYIGPMVATLLTGSFVIEKVFGVPGIGQLFTTSILNRDYTLIMGITVFFAIFLVAMVLVVDIVYMLVDPRIKYDN